MRVDGERVVVNKDELLELLETQRSALLRMRDKVNRDKERDGAFSNDLYSAEYDNHRLIELLNEDPLKLAVSSAYDEVRVMIRLSPEDEKRRREIYARMYAELQNDDIEERHASMDDLACDLLALYGEESFVDAFRHAEKWCA